MWERICTRRGAAGFTLVEVLVSLAILALVGVAVSAISITGVIGINSSSQERQADAISAQWASLAFARDVQGAAAVVPECAPGVGQHLVTVQASDADRKIEYRTSDSGGVHNLVRVECGPGGASRVVIDELDFAPEVGCQQPDGSSGACMPATAPRQITLRVSRTAEFAFELDGSRRTTDGNSYDQPLEVPTFVALGGDTPLEAGGNSALEVVGNAYINRPTSSEVAVDLYGSAQLRVSGEFELQQGALCSGCPTRSNKQPGTYRTRLLDPLRFLAAPDTSSMTVQSDCPVQAGVRVCQPGIYTTAFPPSGGGGGGVKDYVLQPGVYALRDGIKVTNGSLTGDDVLLYNESGNVKINGADLDLEPPTTGIYSGILFFQARSNSDQFEIVGNAALAALTGTIYAPNSTNVVLGGGGGEIARRPRHRPEPADLRSRDGDRRWQLSRPFVRAAAPTCPGAAAISSVRR